MKAWTKPHNHDVFCGPLLYLLETAYEYEEIRPDHLLGHDNSLVSTLRDICADSKTEVYLASVRRAVFASPYDYEDEDYEWEDSESHSLRN